MTPQIKLALLELAAYYEKDLSDEQLKLYGNQLSESLTVEEMYQAMSRYINDPTNEFFPRPVSKLIALVKTPVSNTDVALQATALVFQAHEKFKEVWSEGHFVNGEKAYQGKDCLYTEWKHAAISFFGWELGEVILKVVERYGGWKHLAMQIQEGPEGVVRSQVQKLTDSLLNIKSKTGSFDHLGISGSYSQQIPQAGKILDYLKIKEVPQNGE
jgi:hypothetical protein